MMKNKIAWGALMGMGFGFPVTLLCMAAIGGYNEVIREFLVWLVASALYGILSIVLFNRKNDLPRAAVLGLHILGCVLITGGAALINGYISKLGDVLPILIPAIIIYAVVFGICYLTNKKAEKEINKALEEK